jgi:hypothetical protein
MMNNANRRGMLLGVMVLFLISCGTGSDGRSTDKQLDKAVARCLAAHRDITKEDDSGVSRADHLAVGCADLYRNE